MLRAQYKKMYGSPLDGHPKYEEVQYLSQGGFGFVMLARDKWLDELVAIKFIPRGEQVDGYVEREVLNHRLLHHPCIVKFKEVILTDTHLGIVTEYASGGDLFEYVRHNCGLKEDEARRIFQQLILGVDYCHRMGIINRDIKLENMLLTSKEHPQVKICDFGLSKHQWYQSPPCSRVGTTHYMAPEVLSAECGRVYDGQLADVWSCGVLLFVMMACNYPFKRQQDGKVPDTQKLLQRMHTHDWQMPWWVRASPEVRDLLSRILEPNPAKRISLHAVLRHPWTAKGLDPRLIRFNEVVWPVPRGTQTQAELLEILQAARSPQAAPHRTKPHPKLPPLTLSSILEGEVAGVASPSSDSASVC